ncbi:iron reductase domain protein [Pleomassaria siparia CBS 279.74]|uniref:Iron reductase domain protein n=1 Tax=Pleomassaria siparia CBS 279.74 TaxID=1314801 RepID=A0A6G1K7R6_9PLEO|nr:iron reductase domain protein [Pleomassaria siparia CBS 279.74]
MKGANIFVVYTSGDGTNVTVSPRLASGYQMPTYNSAAQFTLLGGSGVSDGKMVANIKCSNCKSWSGGTADFTASSGSWIYAAHSTGGPKNSNDQSATIAQHNSNMQTAFTWSYSNVKGGSSVNPFVEAAVSNGGGSAPTSSPNSGNGNGFGFAPVLSGSQATMNKRLTAHGILAALAFVVLFPSGAIAIRLASFKSVVALHAAFQIFTYLVYTAAFGIGITLAKDLKVLDSRHPIIGIVVFALLFIQPFLGFIHHSLFKKYQTRTFVSHAHIWLGRIVLVLGIINGGLGFELAEQMHMASKSGKTAYIVLAAIFGAVWIVAIVVGEMRRSKRPTPPKFTETPLVERSPVNGRFAPKQAALCQVFDSIFYDVPMARVKFNANTEYAYLQNFKILQNIFAKHQIDRPIPVESLVKCKMQDNLEFLQFTKRYWDQYFPGHDYDPVSRRKGQAGLASTSAPAPRAAASTARRAPAASNSAAPRTRTPLAAGGGAASAALREENTVLKETVAGLERERDFYFSKLRDIELLIQQSTEIDPELEKEGGLLAQIQTILYSTEEGFEIPAEAEGEPEEETF